MTDNCELEFVADAFVMNTGSSINVSIYLNGILHCIYRSVTIVTTLVVNLITYIYIYIHTNIVI